MSQALEHTASIHADKTAYTFLGRSASFSELNHSVSQFAAGLQTLGLRRSDHIALLLENSPEFIISLYGAMRAGVTVIPINPKYTEDELDYILRNGDVKAVVVLDSLLPSIQKRLEQVPSIEHWIVCESVVRKEKAADNQGLFKSLEMKTFSEVMAKRASFEFSFLHQEETAVILYTSGTTGKPKGAMLTHKNLYSNAYDIADYLHMESRDITVAVLPMFHVFCLTVVLNASVLRGAELLILPAFSPKNVFRAVKEKQATIFAGVPTMYSFLFQFSESSPSNFSSVRLCISGGSSMPITLLENFEKKFNVQISEGYGLSEASPVVTFNPLNRIRKAGSVGCSILNVESEIVNELGEALKPGHVGELVVKGPNVMKGYYKMPEETAVAIRDGWLYTGDLAYQDYEGYFYIVDRKKDLIIVGGYNVYPREVEEVLYAHDAIMEAAVLGIPDRDYGETVLAFVVTKEHSLKEADVIRHCTKHLVSYKVPKTIVFLKELPKNTTGKILRRSLKNQLSNQA